MFFFFNQPKWKAVEYSRSKIIKSGKIIKSTDESPERIEEATKVIDNWRAAHAYPLHVIYMHLRRLASKNSEIIVAERLKRLDSIISKLRREPSMSLWMMQDLGGCRVIVSTIDDVYKYAKVYEESRKRHEQKSVNDYILHPKISGYRSLHTVYEYHSDKLDTYNKNMLIEIQFRTKLQHLWATAVETMGLFTQQAIKSGQGTNDVKRFFALVSSLFAIQENCNIVPDTIADETEIVSEIESINAKCNFLDMLSAIRVAVDNQDASLRKLNRQGYYILILNYSTRRLRINYYKPSQMEEANKAYSQIETT